ncbi:hypothetical protein BDK51DRAFT_34409 [Blyttiomyces helicus]|uniref:Uncharacterized protein n=1 Tax=Blyttiomyces helicus TaxID=388810 RepID=A0A4P9WKY5_9FUNG|nr:hypothetical protein BDK51DRAFT_34409 [Blyttiomyces helicus]|eukprot:RKO92805.1 hypothetical protein BDK51DRAFT_34409 [Blyttiomyces helicus]
MMHLVLAPSIFNILHVLGCLTKLPSSFSILVRYRILRGLSISFMSIAFESWTHRARGFDPACVAETLSNATLGKEIMAIITDVVTNLANALCAAEKEEDAIEWLKSGEVAEFGGGCAVCDES